MWQIRPTLKKFKTILKYYDSDWSHWGNRIDILFLDWALDKKNIDCRTGLKKVETLKIFNNK